MAERPALTRARVIEAAVAVADRGGLAAVSMRNVGRELGVEAMSLYNHVANKQALLDGLADVAFASIALPVATAPWRDEMVTRADSARAVLSSHPWALGLLESRSSPGPAVLIHHNAVLACLRTNGFSIALASHAFSVLDAYVYGFVLTEVNLPFDAADGPEDFASGFEVPADEYPFLLELMTELVVGKDYAFGNEFGYGLDIILDELERRLAAE
ncbi:TetR/AcrR family transcriptional regulator C-terminal domain-containing protein [Agromyces atrinae]|uniref:TetR/AcrR family transcriptional regulator C-terminal domain-containing protein n=1 Tax=Agromyces atrinae TaxID=592376 RepID=UPI001F595206|nr:TetR/AcrR family transcriptional regulator C-terminal domain-containing protein [Agromyces atrinae]MCI2958470.1 TetR/AcrR family transcriptional regulator C-terminal domain-containing protein [Agromyces atrinae]